MTGLPSLARIAFIVVALLAAGVACGQMPGGTGRTGARGGGLDTSHVPPPKPDQDGNSGVTVLSTVQFRLELLEEDLRLLPEQRSAWQSYRDRVLRLAEDSQRAARTALGGGDLSAPKRLDRLADVARDRLTAIEDIVDAGKYLYSTLTPAQQGVADRRMAVPLTALVGVEPNSTTARAGPGGKNP